jgi:hypothetical protein
MARILAVIAAGLVANVVIGDPSDFPGAIDVTELEPRPGTGWAYDGAAFAPPVIDEPPPAPADRRITRLAFRNRFTQAELVAMEIAAIDDPTAPMSARQQAAAIRVMQRQVDNAAFIDLDRADTRAGVQQLEAGSLLAEGRAAEILDGPIDPLERPVGA